MYQKKFKIDCIRSSHNSLLWKYGYPINKYHKMNITLSYLVWVAIIKHHRLCVWNTDICFSQLWKMRMGNSRSKCQQIWLLVKALSLTSRWLLCYCVLMWSLLSALSKRSQRDLVLLLCLIRTLIPL